MREKNYISQEKRISWIMPQKSQYECIMNFWFMLWKISCDALFFFPFERFLPRPLSLFVVTPYPPPPKPTLYEKFFPHFDVFSTKERGRKIGTDTRESSTLFPSYSRKSTFTFRIATYNIFYLLLFLYYVQHCIQLKQFYCTLTRVGIIFLNECDCHFPSIRISSRVISIRSVFSQNNRAFTYRESSNDAILGNYSHFVSSNM